MGGGGRRKVGDGWRVLGIFAIDVSSEGSEALPTTSLRANMARCLLPSAFCICSKAKARTQIPPGLSGRYTTIFTPATTAHHPPSTDRATVRPTEHPHPPLAYLHFDWETAEAHFTAALVCLLDVGVVKHSGVVSFRFFFFLSIVVVDLLFCYTYIFLLFCCLVSVSVCFTLYLCVSGRACMYVCVPSAIVQL